MLISRREFLCWGGNLALLSMLPFPAFGRVIRMTPVRSLWLYNTHTGEMLKEPYWQQGKYIPGGVRRINYLLRDHRSNEVRAIRLSVLDLLFQLQELLDYHKPFDVISGYRSAKTNAKLRRMGCSGVAKNSYHIKGMAVDVRFRGLSLLRARKAACFLGKGGVGYYPSSKFIHMDVRGHLKQWGG